MPGVVFRTSQTWLALRRGSGRSRTFAPMYKTALFLHVLAGATWVGTAVLTLGVLQSTLRRHGPAAAAEVRERLGWADKAIYIPGPLIVLATGIAMVLTNDSWRFSDFWVAAALALFLVTAVVGGGVITGMEKKLEASHAAGESSSPAFGRMMAKYIRWASLDVALLMVFVFLMTVKPGA